MLLLPQKKKITTILMNRLAESKPSESSFVDRGGMSGESEESGEQDEQEAIDACALSILHAIEKKSPRDLANALNDFFTVVDQDEGEEAGEDPLYSSSSKSY